MPIRTSTVVTCGIALLTLVGVSTIFGNSIVAMVAPPPAEGIPAHETPRDTTGGTVVSDPKQPPSAASAPVAAPVPTSGAPVDAR